MVGKSLQVWSIVLGLLLTSVGQANAQRDVAPSGSLYIVSLPGAADIWVDGTYIGHAPALVDALLPGKHTISAARSGWTSQDIDLAVVAGVLNVAKIALAPGAKAGRANGRLAFSGGSVSPMITVDGASMTLLPSGALELPSGLHEIGFRIGHTRLTRRVTIYPETTTNVLARESPGDTSRAAVVAPALNYIAAADLSVEGRRVTIRHNGHFVVATLDEPAMKIDGVTATFDSAPTLISSKLYLPLELYVRIGAVATKAK